MKSVLLIIVLVAGVLAADCEDQLLHREAEIEVMTELFYKNRGEIDGHQVERVIRTIFECAGVFLTMFMGYKFGAKKNN